MTNLDSILKSRDIKLSCPQHKLREWKFFHSGSQGVESEKNITIKKRKGKKKGKMDCHSLNKTRERGVRKMEKGREYERNSYRHLE